MAMALLRIRRLLCIKIHRLDNFFRKSYFCLLEKIVIFIDLLARQETHIYNNKFILLKGQGENERLSVRNPSGRRF